MKRRWRWAHNFDVAVVAIGMISGSILVTCCQGLGVGFVLAKAVGELHGKVLYKPARTAWCSRTGYGAARGAQPGFNILDYIEIAGDLRIVDISACPSGEQSLLDWFAQEIWWA